MGCTDILGISEIRTGAKVIYIGVGPGPFKQAGKGVVGKRMELNASKESEQLEACAPGSFPWAMVFGVIGNHVAFIILVS